MKNLLLAVSMLAAPFIYAQNATIKGRVIDSKDGSPIPGAAIIINQTKGITSNQNGYFELNCSDSVQLKVMLLGYATYTSKYTCTKSDTITIELQQDPKQLGLVEITAQSNRTKSQLDQPASITRIDSSSLRRSTGLFMDDAINTNVPGVLMQRRSISGGQQLNIRGYGNGMGVRGVNSNFDSQGIKMYLNGIPITDAEGITVMDDLDFASMSSVEIIKGPSGSIYGLAIAGAVNMEMKADRTRSIGQDIMIGDYGLFRSTSRFNFSTDKSAIQVNYGRQYFGGYMPHNASRKTFFNIVSDVRVNEQQKISTYLGYINSYDERNGELTALQYDTLDYSGNPRYIKNDAHSAVRTIRGGLSHTYVFNAHWNNQTSIFGSAQIIDQSSAGGWTDKNSINSGVRSVFEANYNLNNKLRITGISGFEAQFMRAQIIGYSMGVDSTNINGDNVITGTRTNQVTTNNTYNYFTQWTLHMPYQFSLTAGIGISNAGLLLEDRLWGVSGNTPNNTRDKKYARQFNNLIAPTVALNKKFAGTNSIYLSYSEGAKTPVASNIVIATTGEVNTVLNPERGRQFELGVKGNHFDNRLFYTLSVFNTTFSNKFTAVTVQNPQNTVTLYSFLVNGGSLINRGLEASITYKVIESETNFIQTLQPFANVTLSDFVYDNFSFQRVVRNSNNLDSTVVEDYSNKAVAGVAPVVFNVGCDFITKVGLYGNIYYNYRSSMPYTSDGANVTEAFGVLNSKIGFRKQFGKFNCDLQAGANNITSTQYYNMVFVNQLPDAFIPAPNEINFFGGLQISYQF